MLETIFAGLKALTGVTDTINGITKAISDSRIASINAKTQEEKIAADERTRSLEARRDILIGEAKTSNANVYTRTFIALPIGVLFWKIFVWDKALGQWTQGRTDALDANLWSVITTVLGFYFLYEGVTGITKIIKGR
jgi:hypothetical protein